LLLLPIAKRAHRPDPAVAGSLPLTLLPAAHPLLLRPAAQRADWPDPAAARPLLLRLPAALVATAAAIAPNLPAAAAAGVAAAAVVAMAGAAVVDREEEPVPGVGGTGRQLVTAVLLL